MRADLHLHTTRSDGVLTPLQLTRRAAESGLDVIALTDHDMLRPIPELKDHGLPVTVLRGTELSMLDRSGLHLLCYGNPENTPLHRRSEKLSEQREHRADAIMDRCDALDMKLDRARVYASAAGSVGRPHIARALVEAGYCRSTQEAFDRYLAAGRPCYVGSERMPMREAIPLALESGFVPVLAHPWEMADTEQEIRALVTAWREAGLMGLEVYHPSARSHGFTFLEHLAKDLGLLVTGGSDFHQDGDRHGTPGCMLDVWKTCDEDTVRLTDAMAEAGSRYEARTDA